MSVQCSVVGVGVLVSVTTVVGATQLPSYSLPPLGVQVPQVDRASDVWPLSTSWRRSVTFSVTCAAGSAPASTLAAIVNVPLMSNERPVNIDTSHTTPMLK